jgi:hypothetical protein
VHSFYWTAEQYCWDIYVSASAELSWRCGEILLQGQSNCETSWALRVMCTLAGTLEIIPTCSQTQASFQILKQLGPKKSTMLEYNQACKHSDTRKCVCHTPQERFHIRWRSLSQASKSALVLGRIGIYIVMRLNSRTLAQWPTRKRVLTKALLQTRNLESTHAWMHVLLIGPAPSDTHT